MELSLIQDMEKDGGTNIVPIHERNVINDAISTYIISGMGVTDYYFNKCLTERGYAFTTTDEREIETMLYCIGL